MHDMEHGLTHNFINHFYTAPAATNQNVHDANNDLGHDRFLIGSICNSSVRVFYRRVNIDLHSCNKHIMDEDKNINILWIEVPVRWRFMQGASQIVLQGIY